MWTVFLSFHPFLLLFIFVSGELVPHCQNATMHPPPPPNSIKYCVCTPTTSESASGCGRSERSDTGRSRKWLIWPAQQMAPASEAAPPHTHTHITQHSPFKHTHTIPSQGLGRQIGSSCSRFQERPVKNYSSELRGCNASFALLLYYCCLLPPAFVPHFPPLPASPNTHTHTLLKCCAINLCGNLSLAIA